MTFRLLLFVLRARFLLILFTLVTAVGTGAALTYMQPKRYSASTFLVLNFEQGNPFESVAIPASLSSSYLATQLDIIRSHKVALKVVEQLDLENETKARNAYDNSGNRNIPIRDWIADRLSPAVTVQPMPNSRVVSLTVTTLDSLEAARYANAFAQAFIATTLELTIEPARRNAAWFDEQLKVLRARLESARARLTEFQLQKGIVALDERLGAETSRQNDIAKKLVEAQMATSDARSRQLGVNHPEYLGAVERERALLLALESQKRKMFEITTQRDELNARSREVEVEEQNYAATLQSYYKTVMESQFNQTNIAVLSPAIPPAKPSSPNIVLNMAGATVLGLVLGLILAVSAEILNPRVRPTQQST